MALEVRLATEADAGEWDRLVEESPQGTLFHTWSWLKSAEKHSTINALGKSYSTEFVPLMAYRGQEPVGLMSLFKYRMLSKDIVVSPPARVETPYMGPILKGIAELKQARRESLSTEFIKCVDDYICSNMRPLYVGIITSPGLLDSRPLSWQSYSVEPRYTYELDVRRDLEVIRADFAKNVRQSIKKAQEAGIEVTFGGDRDMDALNDLLNARRSEQGEAHKTSMDFIKEIHSRFSPDNLRVFTASHNGKSVGGIIALNYKDKSQVWFGNPRASIPGVNEILIWEMIKWSKEAGLARCELVGANSQSLCGFKSKFNPLVVQYFYTKKTYSSIYKVLELLKQAV